MNLSSTRAISRSLILLLTVSVTLAAGAAGPKKPSKTSDVKEVDSGSFGIFVSGKRVATETFRIQQTPEMSTLKSEIKVEEGDKANQTSELQISPSGDLMRYEWHATSPEKAEATVAPQDQMLVERMTAGDGKPLEQPFILPASTVVLDDYFFSQRELLAWRYLASGCHPDASGKPCQLAKSQFGALVPRQRTPIMVTLEYVGKEKVTVRGKEMELSRFNLQTEGTNDWSLWLDDNYRLIRVLIAADNTEVVRD